MAGSAAFLLSNLNTIGIIYTMTKNKKPNICLIQDIYPVLFLISIFKPNFVYYIWS